MLNKILYAKTMTIAALAAMTITQYAGSPTAAAAAAKPAQATAQTQVKDARMSAGIIAKFEELVQQTGKLPQASAYLYANMNKLTIPQVTTMVLHLEEAIEEQLPGMEKKFEAASVQQAIAKLYKKGDTFNELINRTKDAKLRALFTQARNSGYKLETGEGMFYVTVNYATLKKYAARVSEDIRGYINIAAVEANQPPLRDGAIAIKYEEIVNRAITQESFLSKFPKSVRAAKVKALFQSYKLTTFYGANNTPLFDYDSNVMQQAAKKAYLDVLGKLMPDNSSYLNTLQKFMNVLQDNNYTLTAEVTKFRQVNVPNE